MSQIEKKTRNQLIREAGGKCSFPGCSSTNVQIHHVIKKSQMGTNEPTNLLVLCYDHHEMAHAKPKEFSAFWELNAERN